MEVVKEKIRAKLRDAPEGFIPPPLHPADTILESIEITQGVYALFSGKRAVDNSGFVVGEHGVFVIDAHINGSMAGQIINAVKKVTDKPILYLANTNYHGDHTFGNYAFPPETKIISHWKTEEIMSDFEEEKHFLLPTVNDDKSVFDDVKLRLPNIVFDNYLRVNIGACDVELYYFGPGNTQGDIVVYLPESRICWTGNLILGEGTIPLLLEGGPGEYLETIARFERTLEVERIIPGHGAETTAAIFGRYMQYLSGLIESVHTAIREKRSYEETLARIPLPEEYLPTDAKAREEIEPFLSGFHRFNVKKTYYQMREPLPITWR